MVLEMKELLQKLATQFFPALVVFFAPIGGIAIAITVLVLLDTVMGTYAAHKQGDTITSRKMSKLITKSALYLAVLYLIFPIDYYLLNEIVNLVGLNVKFLVTKLVAIGIVSIELTSINENFTRITKIKVWDVVKDLLAGVKDLKEKVEEIKDDK